MQVINQGVEEELFNYLVHSIEMTPYYQLLGVKIRLLGPGLADLEVEVSHQHTNPLGAVHGGLYMSLADAAMGNAVRSLGIKAVTVECATSMMAGASLRETIKARGTLEKVGKNLIFASARVTAGEKLLATTKGTFYRVGLIDINHGS
ncbi:MAG: PaaI family thioesterase [Syntrophomonadaceae bacterium]|nr:PaaI family thioesterase [Syntrophomonadaceae bacterium]MDD3270577.1 PaaI family thioesterase [Syntrophomonadaceae bacterium]MDD3897453.1 PaaI family thioesterase [Syntrophomonadaceae bacterium]MDD4561584.1 PaaI family thioesterase [Syntrophomonadaceae bacterium]